ncbi:MAG: TetR/AcrR family transcriptional regulator C-terminal domain-containing protein [Acidimicrobiia bacterium]|nr:TetR/AcrR family transcriptional regulator C-terminal domain-containing protein [Acidimicrobiia bacterium]
MPPARTPLDRETIVSTAVALADEGGAAALSMRKLARELGFEVMSLYNHVANKDELLTLMVDRVAAEIDEPLPDAEPLAAVRAIAVSTHEVLVRHPWAPELWQRQMPGPARTRRMDDLLRLLDDSGLAPDLAHHGFHAVTNHVLGYTLQELGMDLDEDDLDTKAEAFLSGLPTDEYPHMVAHVHQHLAGDTASSFELVLDLILDGLVRLDEAR